MILALALHAASPALAAAGDAPVAAAVATAAGDATRTLDAAARAPTPAAGARALALLAHAHRLDAPTTRDEARAALADLLLALPPSPAWASYYALALAPTSSPTNGALRVHTALAEAHRADGVASARDALETLLAAEDGDTPLARRARAALLLVGDAPPAEVAAAWRAAADAPLDGVPALTAPAMRVAAGLPGSAPCDAPDTARACAETLVAAGLAERTDRWLATLPPEAAPLARAVLADDGRAASAEWGRAATRDRAAAVRALLDLGDDDGAALIAATDAELAEVSAVSRVRLAVGQPDETATLEAACAAWPENTWLVARLAAARREAGDARGALEALLRLSTLRALDPAEVGRLVEHAWKIDAPERALAPLLDALDRAADPKSFRALAAVVPELLSGAAEAAARGGDETWADELAATARALGAVGGPVYLAGRAWSAGDTETARALYEEALRRRPDDDGVRRAYLRLLAQRGDWEAARAHIAARGGRDASAALRRLAALEELRAASDGRRLTEEDEARLTAAARPFPDDEVAMALGDALLAGLRPGGAVAAYERASVGAPDDPWPRVGLANALLLRGASGDRARVGELLAGLAQERDDAVARRARELRIRWIRSGAAAAVAAGDDREAYDAYVALLAEDGSSAVRARLGELFLVHWQYGSAEDSFREALRRVPVDEAARAGLARARAAAGAFDAAEAIVEAGSVGDSLDPYGRSLALELRVRRVLAAVGEALARGDVPDARVRLAALLADHPHDPEARTARGALALHDGRPDDALREARAVLEATPSYAPALGLAVSAGWASGRIAEVGPLLDAAPSPARWVTEERALVRLAVAIAAAEAAPRARDRRAALARIAAPEGEPATRARALLLLGRAESRAGALRPALARLGAARAFAPDPTDTLRAEADALRDHGRPGAAIRLLREDWETRRDPRVGVPLARHLRDARRGREADAVLAEARALPGLDAPPWRADAPPALPPLDPDLLALRPDERTPAADAALLGALAAPVVPPDGPERAPPAGERLAWWASSAARRRADALELALAAGGPTAATPVLAERIGPVDRVGVSTAGRAGFSDDTTLLAVGVPIARDTPLGPYRLVAEALPAWVNDGSEGALSVAAAVGARSLERGHFRWDTRVGLSASGAGEAVDVTAHARAAWHPGLFGVGLAATRAPATQTRYAWSGGADGTGRVMDEWLEASLAYADRDGAALGALGRLGRLDGPALDVVGWQQATAWASRTLTVGAVALTPGLDGHVQAHDRPAERFVADEAGVFTPTFAASARATVHARWSAGPLALCAGGGGGAQWTRAQPWFLSADVHPAWTASVGGSWAFAAGWRVTGAGVYESSEIGWGGTGVHVGLARGPAAPDLSALPGPTLSSLVHGALLRELGGCATEAR